jgi:uncharacterized membrane protein
MNNRNLDVVGMIVSSIVFIIAYNWNTLIHNYINYNYPEFGGSLPAQLYIVTIMTIVALIVLYYFTNRVVDKNNSTDH